MVAIFDSDSRAGRIYRERPGSTSPRRTFPLAVRWSDRFASRLSLCIDAVLAFRIEILLFGELLSSYRRETLPVLSELSVNSQTS